MSKEATLHSDVEDVVIGHDDYSLRRVPQEARYSWVSVAMQRFGMLSALAQFMLAAFLGFGLKFWDAMLAITLGAIFLEAITIFLGIAGMREGLSTSVLGRWAGFGRKGSALVGLIIALSLSGWFGIQNQVFAAGLNKQIGGPIWLWCIVGGVAVTFIVIYGFKVMNYVAWVAVIGFLLLSTFSLVDALQHHSISELMNHEPILKPGGMGLAWGITLVAGGFMVGAIFTPDMARYNRSVADVIKQTLVGVTLGEYYVGVIGVLLAHTIKEMSPDAAGMVVNLVVGNAGLLGVLILCLSIIKINDWNLYPSSLGVVNGLDGLFGIKISRVYITMVLGSIGTFLSAIGIAGQFEKYLLVMGVLFPPIAAIMICDYFVLKTWRDALDLAKSNNDRLPAEVDEWVPAGLISWAVGALWGYLGTSGIGGHLVDPVTKVEGIAPFNWGVPSFNALIVSFLVYWALGKAGLVKGPKNVQNMPTKVTI